MPVRPDVLLAGDWAVGDERSKDVGIGAVVEGWGVGELGGKFVRDGELLL